jgi:succinyl-CoA synthetase beta subunit
VDLFEFQAKDLFATYGIPVPKGKVATTPDEARAVAAELGGRVVVKSQVKTGGRGKAGGIKLADDPDDARAKAEQILGMDIKGHTVRQVLVEEASDIAKEYYFSILLDRANRSYLVMASAEGGMDIEEVARTKPEALARIPIDPLTGIDRDQAVQIARQAQFDEQAVDGAADIITKLWTAFDASDATLVEVNPMILTGDGRVVALDGKVTVDDNALYRQVELDKLDDADPGDPLERLAKAKDLNYVKLDGQVGIIGNGAGLVMSTLDVVAYAGRGARRRQAGQLPRTSAAARRAGDGRRAGDHPVRPRTSAAVFVNVFGGITSCDAVATASCRRSDCSATRPPSRSSSGWTATTSRRAGASRAGRPPARHRRRHDGRRRRQGRRARTQGD